MPLPLKAGYNFNYAHVHRPPSFECILIKFTDHMISDLLEIMNVDTFDELIGKQSAIHLEKSAQEKVLRIMNEMENEWNAYNKYSEIVLKGLLHKLILIFLNERRKKGALEMPSSKRKQECLTNAIEYVKSHLSESPSLPDTAEHIHVSASYLSKVFINQLHTPYSAFILNEKILYAQKLLVNTKMNMSEIAGKAGFSSSAYFSDCFRRNVHMSPLQFRKRNT